MFGLRGDSWILISAVQSITLVQVYGENAASHRHVVGKGGMFY